MMQMIINLNQYADFSPSSFTCDDKVGEMWGLVPIGYKLTKIIDTQISSLVQG